MTPGEDPQLYESIGRSYPTTRREDPRMAAAIHHGLGDARTVVNVGAGTGNYEPQDRLVVAVDPSATMLAGRRARAALLVQGVAEALPFGPDAFDAALATFTLHHWTDVAAGLSEMRRVAGRQVIVLFDPAMTTDFWPIEYWPEALALPSETDPPSPARVADHLDVTEVLPVPLPIDCTDGFSGAYWGRPEAYLDPAVQAGMSTLAQLPPDVLARGATRLRADLDSGAWDARYGALRTQPERHVGYCLVLAGR